jgi:biopolymer transport protein TolR
VITPMLRPDRLVEMAKTSNPVEMSDAGKPDALIVAVAHDGTIFLGSEIVNGEVLTQKLKDRLNKRSDRTVYVRADARARYRFVAGAVDGIRSAGADQLGLLTEQKQRTIAVASRKEFRF